MNATKIPLLSQQPISSSFFNLLLFGITVLLTGGTLWADSPYYAQEILTAFPTLEPRFWEPGHLLWRPLGHTALMMGLPQSAAENPDEAYRFILTFYFVCNVVAGAYIWHWVSRTFHQLITNPPRAYWIWAAVALLFPTFINFTQTAAPYVVGLALLLLGASFAQRYFRNGRIRDLLCAALACALSCAFWIPFCLSVPGYILLSSSLANHRAKQGILAAGLVVFKAGLISLLIFLIVGISIGESANLVGWFLGSASGKGHAGITRLVPGFAHAFIDLADFGKLAKEFLTTRSVDNWSKFLFGASKLGLFYVTFLILAWSAFKQNKYFALACGAIVVPNLILAVVFDAGAQERYLALYPIFALLFLLGAIQSRGLLFRGVITLFALVSAFSNFSAFGLLSVHREHRILTERLTAFRNATSKFDRVVIVNNSDSVVTLYKGFHYSPFVPTGRIPTLVAVEPNTERALNWRERTEAAAQKAEQEGQSILVSQRFCLEAPQPEWGWIENEQPGLQWKDLHNYYSAHFPADCCTEFQDSFCVYRSS